MNSLIPLLQEVLFSTRGQVRVGPGLPLGWLVVALVAVAYIRSCRCIYPRKDL